MSNVKNINRELYLKFEYASFRELEELLLAAHTREEKAFYRALLNLKLQIAQERVVGEQLV
ncbi:MAG: hypothetical protein IKU48_06085 [Clostridia bacterium]|nr:hypothetical protein [Clostridia bacterium]